MVVDATKPSASHASRRLNRRLGAVSPIERGSPTKHTATRARDGICSTGGRIRGADDDHDGGRLHRLDAGIV